MACAQIPKRDEQARRAAAHELLERGDQAAADRSNKHYGSRHRLPLVALACRVKSGLSSEWPACIAAVRQRALF